MENRLETLRGEIDKLIYEKKPEESRYYVRHFYGVARFCALLALRRKLNPEIASTCGMLHDIYQVTDGVDNHAVMGAEKATELLKFMNSYNDEEIKLITTAISRHSDKSSIHESYDELLKDADVLDHCLHNPDFPIAEHEKSRYKSLMIELGCQPIE